MTFGEPAHKIGEVDYLDEGWRREAPQPLADSLYWYPGHDSYDPDHFGLPSASMVLIDQHNGSLLSLKDIVPPDFGNFLSLQYSPDQRWILIYNGERFSPAVYVISASQLGSGGVNGRVITNVGY